MRLSLKKDEQNDFWIYANSEKDMEKAKEVAFAMETYGYYVCHIDEAEFFIMLTAPCRETQSKIKQDYAAAKAA